VFGRNRNGREAEILQNGRFPFHVKPSDVLYLKKNLQSFLFSQAG